REDGIFIVDDVAFIQERHAFAIGEAIARKNIRKQYYLETRGDVLLRNKEAFKFWKELGVTQIFLGLEAIDDEGLRKYRKRIPLDVFYRELLDTQWVLYRRHLNWRTTPKLARVLAQNLRRGQINLIRGMMNYKKVYNVEKMLADHARPVRYELPTRVEPNAPIAKPALYIHAP